MLTLGSIVGEALVRYINQGITLGSVNMPEVQLRSLTLEEENTARVRCQFVTTLATLAG